MRHIFWLLALSWFCFSMGVACRLVEPGPEGDKARQEGGTIIRSLLPPPWGDIAASAFTLATGTVAIVKGRQANKSRKEAAVVRKIAEVAVKTIQDSPNKEQLAARSKQLSKIMQVPDEMKQFVRTVIPHNDPPKLPDPPKT